MAWRCRCDTTRDDVHGWWIYAEDNVLTAWSGETYDSQASARLACESFKALVATCTIQIDEDNSGNLRWSAYALNGQKIGTSGFSFASRASAKRAVRDVRAHGPVASSP